MSRGCLIRGRSAQWDSSRLIPEVFMQSEVVVFVDCSFEFEADGGDGIVNKVIAITKLFLEGVARALDAIIVL